MRTQIARTARTPSRAPTCLAAAVAAWATLAPSTAWAHTGRPPAPHDLWTAWSFEPAVVFALLASAWLYARGASAVWRRAGAGRGVRHTQAALFAAGWLVLVVALVSPLHALGSALFSAHMVQHELLVTLAAPLLVLGRPVVPALWALPPTWRRRAGDFATLPSVHQVWRWLTAPLAATAVHAAALWLWHLPAPYQATLHSDAVHAAQHASFLLTALLFWWAVLRDPHRSATRGVALFSLFLTVLHTGALGALLTFARTPWYLDYAPWTRAWGLTPLEDQQIGGLVMWIPGGVAYVAAALWMLAGWLRADSASYGDGIPASAAP